MSGAVEGSRTEEEGSMHFTLKKQREKALHEKRWLQQLMDIFEQTGTGISVELVENVELTDAAEEQGKERFAVTAEVEQQIAPLPTFCGNGRSYFTASALQTYLHCQRQYYYQQVLELPPLEATNCVGGECDTLPAYVTGLIVHRALELYRGDAKAALAKAVSEQELEAAPVAKYLFEQYLDSALYKSLPAEHRREQRFLLPEGGLMLEGIIDYLADTQDGLVLVDYKTGAPPADDEVHDGYAYQLAIYKAAAEQMYKKPVVRAELHFLQNNTRWTLPEADTYYNDALALCRKIAAKCDVQDFACTAGRACSYCPYAYICPQDK